jgi:hypothetical protein
MEWVGSCVGLAALRDCAASCASDLPNYYNSHTKLRQIHFNTCFDTALPSSGAASVVKWLACWPLIPKIAVLNTVKAVGFFGRKNPQYAFFQRRSKAVCPMSQICGMLKNPVIYVGVGPANSRP